MTTVSDLKCRICGTASPDLKEGQYLGRANPKGVLPAEWECRPKCDVRHISQESMFMEVLGPATPPQEDEK